MTNLKRRNATKKENKKEKRKKGKKKLYKLVSSESLM